MLVLALCLFIFSERELTFGALLSVTLVHPTQYWRLKFSAIFLYHLVPWPLFDIREKFTETVPGEPIRWRS